jgi:hypothetical protein
MLFSLVFLILTPLCLSCDCSDQQIDPTSNKNFLHSFAVMNMDHLYYGVPFYGSTDHVYFHYSEDFPCHCNNLTIAKNTTDILLNETIINIQKGNTSRKLKKTQPAVKKNLRKNEEETKKSKYDVELKALEEIYQRERNSTTSIKMFNNTSTSLLPSQNKTKNTPEIKFIEKESQTTGNSLELKNDSSDEIVNNKYISEIDQYYENILQDSVSDFEDAIKRTLIKVKQ